jgi:hypothetical protein
MGNRAEEEASSVAPRLDYRWNLRQVMASRGMFATTDLIGPLAQRGSGCPPARTALPAAILARLFGIHINAAATWQRASAGDWTAYAAKVSRRTHPRTGIQTVLIADVARAGPRQPGQARHAASPPPNSQVPPGNARRMKSALPVGHPPGEAASAADLAISPP